MKFHQHRQQPLNWLEKKLAKAEPMNRAIPVIFGMKWTRMKANGASDAALRDYEAKRGRFQASSKASCRHAL